MKKVIINSFLAVFLTTACDLSNNIEVEETLDNIDKKSTIVITDEEADKIILENFGEVGELKTQEKFKFLSEYLLKTKYGMEFKINSSSRITGDFQEIYCGSGVYDGSTEEWYIEQEIGSINDIITTGVAIRRSPSVELGAYASVYGIDDMSQLHLLTYEQVNDQTIDCEDDAVAKARASWGGYYPTARAFLTCD